jgi:hypothetical protein
MQREPVKPNYNAIMPASMIYGGSVETWVLLHDAWHRELLRALLVLQGEYVGDADEAAASVPRLVRVLHRARAKIPPHCRATDPDHLVAASAKRCVKNAGRFVLRTPRWAMEN